MAVPRMLLPCCFPPPWKIVISTEAAHGLIVSSAAEKSASLHVYPGDHRAPPVIVAFQIKVGLESLRPDQTRIGPPSTKGEAANLLVFAVVFRPRIYFSRFPPKNRMSSPKTT